MSENDLREKYIRILMKKGASRKIAEETVDIIDDDGNVVGLISEDELVFELMLRDIFRRPDVLAILAKNILENNSYIPNKLLISLKEALQYSAEKPSAPPQSKAEER